MSIIFLDNIFIKEDQTENRLPSNSTLIFLNTLSVVFCAILVYFYKIFSQMRKVPSK